MKEDEKVSQRKSLKKFPTYMHQVLYLFYWYILCHFTPKAENRTNFLNAKVLNKYIVFFFLQILSRTPSPVKNINLGTKQV